jgi:hypothetical protein
MPQMVDFASVATGTSAQGNCSGSTIFLKAELEYHLNGSVSAGDVAAFGLLMHRLEYLIGPAARNV